MDRNGQDGWWRRDRRIAGSGLRACGRGRGFVRGEVVPWVVAIGATAVSAIVCKELTQSGAREGVATQATVLEVRGDSRNLAYAEADAEVRAAVNAGAHATRVDVAEDGRAAGTADLVFGPPIELMGGYVEPMGPPAVMAGGFAPDPSLRWFDGRPVKPARVVWMKVTAYSPDARSCGDSADGITATLHCVTTNGHWLVAADPKVLPYGSMLTIPGYAIGAGGATEHAAIVPVLDCGGAIKGQRLDVLFPTHEEAIKWGVRELPVTVWKYVDGGDVTNPRKVR
jgi:3D (Asp-Asp-Asp) domain-containing protein